MSLKQEISFSDLTNKARSVKPSTVKAICFVIFSVIIIAQSWIADDSYHAFVMTKNFMNGYGLVYNIGERVNAATCPLMLLLVTALSCLTRHIELTAIAIGVVNSMISFGLIIRHIKSKSLMILATLICCLSYGFIAYTTSGLETSLIYLIQILYFDYVINHKGKYSFKQLCYIALLCSLSLLTRFDTCFLMFFPTAYIFLRKKECSICKMLLAGFLGLQPFFAWLVFSVIYYGYPFPNTYYVKVRIDLPLVDYLAKGFNYFKVNLLCDPVTLIIILIALGVIICKGDSLRRMTAVGMIMKLVYILRIGGDFMLGRHLAGLFIVSVYLIFDYAESSKLYDKKKLAIVGGIIPVIFIAGLMISPLVLYPFNEIADERAIYIPYTSLHTIIKSEITKENYPLKKYSHIIKDVEERIEMGYKGDILYFAPGILVYNYGDRIRMTDQAALADPLLPYTGVDWERSYDVSLGQDKWRIGHLQRAIPDGYRESLHQNANLITDPETRELYDKILLVIRGEVFTRERFIAIWELNTKYSHFVAGG